MRDRRCDQSDRNQAEGGLSSQHFTHKMERILPTLDYSLLKTLNNSLSSQKTPNELDVNRQARNALWEATLYDVQTVRNNLKTPSRNLIG